MLLARLRPVSWFWRELLKVLIAPLFAFGVLAMAIAEAYDRGERVAWFVLAAAFSAGAAAILLEGVVAWRRGTLFIRDRRKIEKRSARNLRLSRVLIGPAFALAALLAFFPQMARLVLFGLTAGYLVAWSVGLVLHFAKNHREIERLTT
jgi:hypothetical protein